MPKHRTAKEIPLREALEKIGTNLFADLWTGKELNQHYFGLFYLYRGQLDDPKVKEFLRSDLNDPEAADLWREMFKDEKFFLQIKNRRPSKDAKTSLLDEESPLRNWPKTLTTAPMAGTYQRFWHAWEILLTALQDGTIKAFEICDDETKQIPRAKWHSRRFNYDILTSSIFTKTGHADDECSVSRCYVQTEEVVNAINDEHDDIIIGRGKPTIKPQLLQKLKSRAQRGEIKSNILEEAAELQRWAKEELVPSNVGSIKNIIEKEHAKLVTQGKKKK